MALEIKVNENTPEQVLTSLLNSIAEESDPGPLKQRLKPLAASATKEDVRAACVIAAGLYGVVAGSKLMQSDGTSVDPFCHQLRKALLASKSQPKVKENAPKYIFYPEFFTDSITSLRARIAAVARAHAKKGPKDDVLPVLYSLGGYFDKKAADGSVKVTQSGGTTCIMTARAVYHAAGASMIGERVPTVNTPQGANVELGVPALKVRNYQKDGMWKQEKYGVATVERDDRVQFRGGFNEDDETKEPNLEVGDIYLVDGDEEHKYLMRGQGALAAHVGIVVARTGRKFTTVDGGSGLGAEIGLNENREMYYKKDVGWTFGGSHSFSTVEIAGIDAAVAAYESDAGAEGWILSDRDAAGIRPNYLDVKRKYDAAIAKGDEKLAKIYKGTINMILGQARRLIRIKASSRLGEVRTIQGWWKPERYEQLKYVSIGDVAGW